MPLERKHVLITVKTYPTPSKTYIETVCCAGIDLDTGSWIRLYPVPFRDLDRSRQFKKYDIIEVKCEKAPKDHRVESYHIDQGSIKVLGHLDSKQKWRKRAEIILPTASPSFCHIQSKTAENVSLGTFKPSRIGFLCKKAEAADDGKRQACYMQLTFFDRRKNVIEKVPYDFYYEFHCAGEDACPGHRLKIIDWELGQAYRKWREETRSAAELLEKIRQKWLVEIYSERNDVYFYVGNMHVFRDQFLVLGVFYPKK